VLLAVAVPEGAGVVSGPVGGAGGLVETVGALVGSGRGVVGGGAGVSDETAGAPVSSGRGVVGGGSGGLVETTGALVGSGRGVAGGFVAVTAGLIGAGVGGAGGEEKPEQLAAAIKTRMSMTICMTLEFLIIIAPFR